MSTCTGCGLPQTYIEPGTSNNIAACICGRSIAELNKAKKERDAVAFQTARELME